MITCKSLSYTYGSTVLFDRFNLHIDTGERVVIMGASGSGKSTLLRLLAGFLPPLHGEIFIDGQKASADRKVIVSPRQRQIGMLFQDLALWPHMNVAENIGFGLRIQGYSAMEQNKRIKAMLAIVGLEGYEARTIESLSGGEKQRVALARALSHSPRIVLMDEPLSNLDIQRKNAIARQIVNLQERLGFTLVYVTHDPQEAYTVATRQVSLDR